MWIIVMLTRLARFMFQATLAVIAIGFFVVVAAWTWSFAASLAGAAGSPQTRGNMDGALAYAGSQITGWIPDAFKAPKAAPPAPPAVGQPVSNPGPSRQIDKQILQQDGTYLLFDAKGNLIGKDYVDPPTCWWTRQWFDGISPEFVPLRNGSGAGCQPQPTAPAPAPAAPVAPVAARVAPAPAPAPALVATTLCNSQKEQHTAVAGQGWTPSGSWRIVNFWTNEAGKPQGERKLLLAPGQNPTLMGGGSSWSWPSGCESTVRGEYAQNGLAAVDLVQLQAEGLAR